jgi:hypothetical protein
MENRWGEIGWVQSAELVSTIVKTLIHPRFPVPAAARERADKEARSIRLFIGSDFSIF